WQTAPDWKMLGQPLDAEQRRGFVGSRAHSRTCIAWRSPPLSRLKHIEGVKISTPGRAQITGSTHNQCTRMYSSSPHSGLDGDTPRPRNDSPADRMIAMLIRLVA